MLGLNDTKIPVNDFRSVKLQQPHFLYNSLTSIRACLDEPDKARELINHFSCFLRGSIDVLEETDCIRTMRELETVDHYLFTEKERFDYDLTVVKDIRDDGFTIPAFAIQTLVEYGGV